MGVLIILVNSLCMPGSTECVDNEMKTCGVDGEWIVVDCPVGTKCSNSNGKIGCKSRKREFDDVDSSDLHSSRRDKARRPKISQEVEENPQIKKRVKNKTVTVYKKAKSTEKEPV